MDLTSNDEAVSIRKESSIALCDEYTCDHEECKSMYPLTMCCQCVFEMVFEIYCMLHDLCNVYCSCLGEGGAMLLHGR